MVRHLGMFWSVILESRQVGTKDLRVGAQMQGTLPLIYHSVQNDNCVAPYKK